ncbi:MAG: hypothetical protein LBU11_00870 [Zoogloeaceae bacterium]|nr:hypothetical protein [Zoogloeaceae bacterium]
MFNRSDASRRARFCRLAASIPFSPNVSGAYGQAEFAADTSASGLPCSVAIVRSAWGSPFSAAACKLRTASISRAQFWRGKGRRASSEALNAGRMPGGGSATRRQAAMFHSASSVASAKAGQAAASAHIAMATTRIAPRR